MNVKKVLIRTLTIIGFITLLISKQTDTLAATSTSKANYNQLSDDLIVMNQKGLFSKEENDSLTFDAKKAIKDGFSSQSVQLAEELTALTNDLTSQAARNISLAEVKVTELKVDMAKYRRASDFFQMSEEKLSAADSRVDTSVSRAAANPEYVCGSWSNPVPRQATPAKTYGPYSFPWLAENQMSRWGYHRPPSWYQAIGWTRPQNYQTWICGRNTFRDHAWTINPRSGVWYINEQNYTGGIPGEPNPEVWASGPWPYPLWPAYVYWWHATH